MTCGCCRQEYSTIGRGNSRFSGMCDACFNDTYPAELAVVEEISSCKECPFNTPCAQFLGDWEDSCGYLGWKYKKDFPIEDDSQKLDECELPILLKNIDADVRIPPEGSY